ncbi:hypothetical protein Cgig2_005836 [Carnegiea gigantea]|uniref:Cytochrome P450 n=1 Tax=Carnegiea gigantea TaxID=171969 RepID=A0A9Q1KNQ4_9CARY|nr:hypothetical protein Cgig2_005836 [Carnegiea gigantea]
MTAAMVIQRAQFREHDQYRPYKELDIIVAGTDTSAAMVVWTMTELIKNSAVMRKVQDELRNLIRGKNFIDEDDLPKLTYLKAVVKETFRFHPAAPLLIVREAIQNCSIQGYDILPKSLLLVNVWAIGRDPEIWDNPEKFMPERFLGSSVDFKGQDFELIPFGAGRRMCPGMLLGIANLELALANLLYSFDWELPIGVKKEDIDTDMIPGIAMHKKNPLCFVAKKFPQVNQRVFRFLPPAHSVQYSGLLWLIERPCTLERARWFDQRKVRRFVQLS